MSRKDNKYKLLNRLTELSEPYQKGCYNELWSQWVLVDYVDSKNSTGMKQRIIEWNTLDLDNQEKENDYICFCSHKPIYELNFMENSENGNRCVIGSCCIKKFSSKGYARKIRIEQGKIKGNRYCSVCQRKLPDTLEKWKHAHRTCYYKGSKKKIYDSY